MWEYILIGSLIMIAIIYKVKFGKKKQESSIVYIIGEKGAGKTSLLYYLSNRNNSTKTTSSVEPNETILVKKNLQVPISDVPGTNYQKEQFLGKISQAKKIILMIDSSQIQQIHPSAEFLYNILIQNDYLRKRIPILIVLNKQDHPKSFKAPDFEQLLNKQIESIKKSRKAIQESRENITDKIKYQENQFEISEQRDIKIVEQSVINEDVQEIENFIFK
ncbi:hypothetical protein pb186bvf_007521 [Paramecium bursaria]